MKRDFLKNIKIGDQELSKEAIDAILDENNRDIESVKAKYGGYDDIKQQLAEANKTIEEFRSMDIDGIKKAADDWKQKAEQAEREAAEKIEAIQFDGLIDSAITKAKGKNTRAIRALLDVDALKQSKNREADINAALDAVKKENGYLFGTTETPPPYAAGTGTTPTSGKYSPETNAIRAAAGLKAE